MAKKKKPKIMIEDVHAEWHAETECIQLVAEYMDGHEEIMIEYMPLIKPLFADETLPSDATDYGDFYNDALEEAHHRNYYIAGENPAKIKTVKS